MARAAEAMEYERAAALRDRIRALTAVQSVQAINPRRIPEADIVALHLEGGQACVQVFFIRGNQSWGNRDFYPRLNGVVRADRLTYDNETYGTRLSNLALRGRFNNDRLEIVHFIGGG